MRAFVGSRGSSVDTTFNDQGEDASNYGFPPPLSYVFNLTNIAEGGTPIKNRDQYINQSAMAEGLVGGGMKERERERDRDRDRNRDRDRDRGREQENRERERANNRLGEKQ